MKQPSGDAIFSGIVEIEGERCFLRSGGLSAELVPPSSDGTQINRDASLVFDE